MIFIGLYIRNRRIKVTGFSLKPAIKQQLFDLFLRVGQVQKVFLAPDRNSAFVQLVYKSAVEFAVGQEWRLGNDWLRVQPCVTRRDSPSPVRSNIASSQILSEQPSAVDLCLTSGATYSEYLSSRNKLWVDFPHEKYGTLPSKKKRKRPYRDDCRNVLGSTSNHTKKRKTKIRKKKQKKKCICSESFPSIPFGVTPVGTAETAESFPSIPFGVAPVGTAETADTREVYIKGTDTKRLVLPRSSTAGGLRNLVSEATGVPADLLHVTVGGRSLTDEVVGDIEEGSTVHYSVKGVGGADSSSSGGAAQQNKKKRAEDMKNEGNEMYKEERYKDAIACYSASIVLFPLAAAFNNRAQCYLCLTKWDECIHDCDTVLRQEPDNLKALLRRGRALKEKGELQLAKGDLNVVLKKGSGNLAKRAEDYLQEIDSELSKLTTEVEQESGGTTLGQLSKSARKRQKKKKLKNTQKSTTGELLQQCSESRDAPPCESESKVEDDVPSVTGKSETFPREAGDTGMKPASFHDDICTVTSTSSATEVQQWLQKICKLTEEHLHCLEGINGTALFAYKTDVEKLVDHTEVPIGIACKIFFLRDNPDYQSAMMMWNVQEVIGFIESVAPGQNLSKVLENQIDGPALLSYENDDHIRRDLKVKKLIAFQIYASKEAFLKKERKSKYTVDEIHEFVEDAQMHTVLPQNREMGIGDSGDQQLLCDGSASDPLSFELDQSARSAAVVPLKTENPFTVFKLFFQNELHLQPLQDSTGRVKQLKECELRVLFHKRKNLNKLEKQFMFLMLCKTELCRGKSAKEAYTKLWKMVRENVSSTWSALLPNDVKKILRFEKDRIYYEDKPISFDDETAKILSVTEYQKSVRYIHECSTPVLIIDKQLLEKDAAGYFVTLKLEKVKEDFCFGFDENVLYWVFDSSDFGWGFKNGPVERSMLGNLPRCHYCDSELIVAESSGDSVDADVSKKESQQTDDKSDQSHSAQPNPEEVQDITGIAISDTDEMSPDHEPLDRMLDLDGIGDEEVHESETTENLSPLSETVVYVCPRPFKKKPWKYGQGILRTIETGDSVLSTATEFKFQAGCSPHTDTAFQSFLYKSFEFICGCLNARKNGTIYFGIAERPIDEVVFSYGEIHGMEMNEKLCADYYDAFHDHLLQQCFPACFETVKLCVSGPHFIPIRNTDGRYVIEVDVEPSFSQTKGHIFQFFPKPIFDKYGQPKKHEKSGPEGKKEKHVYLKNQDHWTGVFRRDGSKTMYIDENSKMNFEKIVLPDICAKRDQEEKKELQAKLQLLKSAEADTLKQFMAKCDTSMFPILVVPKLSEEEKTKNLKYFEFIHHVRWSAVLDFDSESERNGIYSTVKSSTVVFEIKEAVVSDFGDMSVEERKDRLSFPKTAVWLFTNGKLTGDNAFERLGRKAWKDSYWTYIQNAVAFYKDNSVIPRARRLVLILISDEFDDGIMEASQDIKTAFTWNTVLFVFNSPETQEHFAEVLSDDLHKHSVVMPWKHVYYVICQSLNLKGLTKDKYVCASTGAEVAIPINEWQSWSDLDILSIQECQEQWASLAKKVQHEKASDKEQEFYQGKQASWWNFFLTDFHYDHVMKRNDLPKLLRHIEEKIGGTEREIDRVPVVTISHMPSAGGTTLGRHVLWTLKDRYKCAVITRITVDTERHVTQFWESVEEGQDQMLLKPVILLADNLTNDSSPINEFELSRRLYRRQKELQLQRPLAILIHCHQSMTTEGKFQLTHKLSEEEKRWMEKKSATLEEQYSGEGFETFIAFLAMRHEFDQPSLQKAIIKFLKEDVLFENERRLIEFISLITLYFPLSEGMPGLPVISCDGLMETYDKNFARRLPWEKTLSKAAKLLLSIEFRYGSDSPRNVVRIANQPYAKVILETVLNETGEQLGDLVLRCLNSAIVSSSSPSCKEVIGILGKMLIERHFDETSTQMALMSPLIMDIKEEFDKAVEIFKVGYKRLKNEVFYQQLARLYMSVNRLDEALEFAQLAVQLSPEKRDFKHTLGVVHLRKFDALKARTTQGRHFVGNFTEPLKAAFLALTNFIEAQGKADDDAMSICYAFCQTSEVVTKVLQFLSDSVPEGEMWKVGKHLTEPSFDSSFFDDLPDKDKLVLKTLLTHGIEALRFLFYLAYSHSVGRMGSSYQGIKDSRTMEYVTDRCERQMSTLSTSVNKLRIQRVSTSQYENGPKEDNALRLRNVYLKGCFFESIFFRFKKLNSRSKQKRTWLAESFQEIKNNLNNIGEMTFFDMDNWMTIHLAIEITGVEKTFTNHRSEIYKACDKIIRSDLDSSDPRKMRAHLYRVLVSWPHERWEGFNEDDFRKSFQQKFPILMHKKEQLLPKVHFFVTKPSEDCYLCHWTEIYGDGENQLVPSAEMRRLLQSFTGYYKLKQKPNGEQYSSIDMEWKCAAGVLRLTIWKIRGEKVFREEWVEFYLGFSLQGPVAFIHKVLPNTADRSVCD